MDAAAELGMNSVSKRQIQPEFGDEQADAGRNCLTRLARPKSQVRMRTRDSHFPCSADPKQDWQPYPVDPYSCYTMRYHTNIHGGSPLFKPTRVHATTLLPCPVQPTESLGNLYPTRYLTVFFHCFQKAYI